MSRVAVVGEATAVARLRRLAGALDVVAVGSAAEAPADALVLVIGEPTSSDDPRITHIVRSGLPDEHLGALVRALAAGRPIGAAALAEAPTDPNEARRAQVAFAASRKLAAASDSLTTERLAREAIVELCEVERAYCLFFDAADGSLWSEAKLHDSADPRRAIAGVAGWAARTGMPALVPRAGDDSRWHLDIDDPDGDANSELIVQPVIGADGHVHAVLVAARRPRATPLGERHASQLQRFAALIAPLLDQLTAHVQAQQLVQDAEGEALFRREALDAAEPRQWGDVVRVSPSWVSWSYWVLVALLVGAAAFVCLVSVSTYSSGPALIRSTARASVTARTSGNVTSVEVMPGDRVEAGAVIARLDDVDQRAAVERIVHAFDTQLRNHMLDPSDPAADAALRTLRLERERALAALAERTIVAPVSGTVSDLRLRPGQHLEPGDVAGSIVGGEAALELVALLPGEDRPQLAPGMQLRLEIAGYRYAYQQLVIESVSSDVIGPSEARRVLGAEVAEGLRLGGSVVLVRARIPTNDFTVDGRTFDYHDGMRGTAEIRVRSERAVFALIPGLRRL
jgi:membrane fusion protein (multidrug efflux system)